jgi:thiaminase/transcriptional activator TenA
MMGPSGLLREKASPIWERIFAHPFVQGIGDGTLPLEKFKFYLCQDYVFLVEYCRVLALASSKAQDLDAMEKFAELLYATLHTEMALHRGYAQKFGIGEEELERTQAAPTTYAYTRHLLSVASTGTLAELAASLLPCQWGYAEIGQGLAQKERPSQSLYGEWIQMYASAEFAALAGWLRTLLDDLAEGRKAEELGRLEELYMTSTRYEYLFWEMSDKGETWPV